MRALIIPVLLAPAAHAGTFDVPKGCTAYLTVQSKSCQVEHHWTCSADPKGIKWRAEIGQNGPFYIGKIDDEAQWIDSYFVPDAERETLILPAPDPASLSELFAQGLDSYQFSLNTPKGRNDVTGFDRIAQSNVMIDGEVLERTEYTIRIVDEAGEVVYASQGSEYVSKTHRRFFSGYGEVTGPGEPYTYDNSPIEFIYPGETGFLDNTPRYGCEVVTTRAKFSERTQP